LHLDEVPAALSFSASRGLGGAVSKWSDRYPRIVEAAKNIKGTFLIDGGAVVSDELGIGDFERLHSREHGKSATLRAFDLLELNGEDL
jgi:bifunctional non-homologous end joining protein LigD